MMFMKDFTNRCSDYAMTSDKIIWLVTWLTLVFAYTSAEDGNLCTERCLNPFVTPSASLQFICLSIPEYRSYQLNSCKELSVISITGLLLHIPKDPWNACPEIKDFSEFVYNQSLNSSCLMKANPKTMKKLLLPIMEQFSGKTHSEINSSIAANMLISEKLFGLPNNTLLELKYNCTDKNRIIPFVDICGYTNMTDKDIEQVHITFNTSLYSSMLSSSACSCLITSMQNKSKTVSIRAVDVRLVGNTILSLSGTTSQTLNSSALFWWENDASVSSLAEITVELSKINPSQLPHSVWLQVTGQNLSVHCGNYSWQNLDLRVSKDSFWYVAVVGIIVGILACLVLLVVFLRKCVYKRSQTDKEYAIVSTGTSASEVMIVQTPYKSAQHKNESMDTCLDASNVYSDVDPSYAEADASGRNFRNFKTTADAEKANRMATEDSGHIHGTLAIDNQNNIYSHLREAPEMNPSADLYDTVQCDEYSKLQRNEPKTVIDNLYST